MGGCCSSVPDAPDVIIPDPEEDEACTFAIKSMGMFSSDYLAYQGEDTDNKDARWFFINKTGSFWSGDCKVDLENFVRGTNEEKPSQGEVMWKAKFDGSPYFEKVLKSPSTPFTRFLSGFGGPDLDGEDPSDESYFRRAGREFRDGGVRRIMKWSLKTKAIIKPGKRGTKSGDGYDLNVFARGASACDYDRETRELEDGRTEKVWVHNTAEFVDQLQFQLVHRDTGDTVCTWSMEGDFAPQDSNIEMDCDIFRMEMQGGWWSSKPVINTKAEFDPTLGLILGYLCSTEYSPKEIKNDLYSDFPEDPFAWGGGWGSNGDIMVGGMIGGGGGDFFGGGHGSGGGGGGNEAPAVEADIVVEEATGDEEPAGDEPTGEEPAEEEPAEEEPAEEEPAEEEPAEEEPAEEEPAEEEPAEEEPAEEEPAEEEPAEEEPPEEEAPPEE